MSVLPTVPLGEVARFVRGITFKPEDVVPVGGEGSVACMRTKNVQVELDLADVWGIPVTFVKREDQFLVDGDLLVSSANSWNLVGKCCWVPPLPWRATFGGFISVLRADRGRLDPRYLYHWFSSANVQAIVRSFGQQTTNISNLNVERCLRLEVPLPTLNEQRRIAAVLDQAAALRAKRRAALAHLDTLAQSIFLDMFGDPATNPMGWPVQRLDQVTECLDRLRRPVTEADRKPGTVPYYGANGRQGWIDRALFDEPLVLVAEDGGYFDAPQRGVAYRIDGPAWVNNHAHILRALPDYVDTEFLHRALRHFDFGPYISGTTRAKLTQGQLNGVRLIVPPLSLQRKFAERVKATLLVKNSLTTMSGRLEELCASLQYRSFVGNFVP